MQQGQDTITLLVYKKIANKKQEKPDTLLLIDTVQLF